MEHEGFLCDIWEHPDDDTPRLVYADWLEEQGNAARAELIRVQCERQRLPYEDPRRDALYQREQELLKAHGEEWKPLFLKPLGERASVSFERGVPAYTVIKEAKDDDLLHLIGHIEVRKLLFLEGQGVTDAGLVHLLRLPSLEVLGLNGTAVTDEGMRIVAQFPRLQELGINETRVTDAGVLHLHEAARLAYIWFEESEGITEEALERWKVRRMQRFRKRSPEERRQEAVCVFDGLCNTSLRREGGRITRVDLWQRPVSDADLEYFKEVPEIEEIDLTKTPVTGQGLRHFSGLKALRKLELHQTRVDDLKGLAGLTSLKELGVSPALGAPDERLTERGTAALRTLTNLEVLALPYTSIGSLTLKRLAGLRLLRDLNLGGLDGISNDGLAGLATLERLERLDLSGWGQDRASLTDNGLQHLAGLKRLVVLNLENRSITDAGLIHLRGLTNLEYLALKGTQATVQGAEVLLTFLPKVSIVVADTLVKHTNPHPRFTRREVEERASFEVPDDWEVRDWETFEQHLQIFEQPFVEQFAAEIREDGYRHLGMSGGTFGPGEVSFHRFPVAKNRTLVEIHQACVRCAGDEGVRPGKPRSETHPLPRTETLSWRYKTDRGSEQHLDFAWRRDEMCYLMCCSCPVGRFAGLEPFFLRMARSFWFAADGPPPESLP